MSRATEPGLDEHPWINGEELVLPAQLDPQNYLAQTLSNGMRPRLDIAYFGVGMPNVMDRFEWVLQYSIGEENATTCAQLETLRTMGNTHLFVDWKSKRYTYTARSGEQFFYLPRQDAFSLGYDGHGLITDYGAKIWRNGVAVSAADIVYQSSVTSGTSVPVGKVYISNSTVEHPDCGFVVAGLKFGDTVSSGDVILAEFYAAYRVGVVEIPTKPFDIGAGREDKTLYLAEVA